MDEARIRDPRTGAALMAILSGKARVADTLEKMHRSGVLGAIIPEFGNLYARVVHDLYHIYTVDRHSLAAVRELEQLVTSLVGAGEIGARAGRTRHRDQVEPTVRRRCGEPETLVGRRWRDELHVPFGRRARRDDDAQRF